MKRKVGRPKKNPRELLDRVTFIRLTASEHRRLKAAAKRAGLRPSQFVRRAVEARLRETLIKDWAPVRVLPP